MRLLIITQKVDEDDPILGFFRRWIIEFSKHFEAVTVICLEEGKHVLPSNVKILSLEKVKSQKSKVKNQIAFTCRFTDNLAREERLRRGIRAHESHIRRIGRLALEAYG